MSSFKLGIKAKDLVSGFEGIIVSRAVFLHGCERYGLAPTKLDDDGRPSETAHFDAPRLVVIDSTPVLAEGPEPENVPPLGSTAKDTITGYEGIVVGYSFAPGGQCIVGLQSPKVEKGEPAKERWWEHSRVALVEKGEPKVSPDNSAPTGGPEHTYQKSYSRA